MEDGSSRRVRTLVTQMARRDLSGNKIACALISMMARSTCSNRRPNTLTQDPISQRRPKPLAPRGGPYIGSKAVRFRPSKCFPVCTSKHTQGVHERRTARTPQWISASRRTRRGRIGARVEQTLQRALHLVALNCLMTGEA